MAAPKRGAALPWLLRKLARAVERDEETAAKVLTVLQRGIAARPDSRLIAGAQAHPWPTIDEIAGVLVPKPQRKVGRPAKTREHIRLTRVYDEAMALRKAGELTKADTDRVTETLAKVCGTGDESLEPATVTRIASDMRAEAAATPAVDPEGITYFVRRFAKPRRR